jgi:hypothetical protein
MTSTRLPAAGDHYGYFESPERRPAAMPSMTSARARPRGPGAHLTASHPSGDTGSVEAATGHALDNEPAAVQGRFQRCRPGIRCS